MKRKITLSIIVILTTVFLQASVGQSNTHKRENHQVVKEREWIPLFNGKDLDGWVPKVTGYRAGENPLNGFRVENGILKVDYSNFNRFNGRFGHLFYKKKFSSYILHVEYRFVGELLPGAPNYCYRNSGVMTHSQSPESMDITQNWPVSIEAQLLGSTVSIQQTTANVCTPGTTVYFNGILSNEHCINSGSAYYSDSTWISLDIIVHGGKDIFYVMYGDTVLTFSRPQVGGFLLPENYPVPSGTVLEDGYIALQAEGQPIDFRKVDLKLLDENLEKSLSPDVTWNDSFSKKNVIDDFENYSDNEKLAAAWYNPGHGGKLRQSLDSTIKGGGKSSLKCEYTTEKSNDRFYSPVCRLGKWDLSLSNGVQFWFKPDGSGREMTLEFNIASQSGKNIHDLWGYVYKPEKGDTSQRIVTIPFLNLVHNTKFADSPDVSPVFKPEAVIETAIYIGGKNDEPGTGVYYFDEISGSKLQF